MPFECRQAEVLLSDIDSSIETFRITTNSSVADLASAVERVGLTNPPILKPTKVGYVVVCGFRRIAAARSLGLLSIPARLLPDDLAQLSCALLSISENSIERTLNLIETSRALFLLSSLIEGDEELGQTAEKVGLPSNSSQIKRLLTLCTLPKPLQEGILSENLALPSAQMLSKFPEQTALALADLIIKLRLSLHKQRELIGIIEEISIREDCLVESILESQDLCRILNDPGIDLPLKAGKIRDYFKQRRYPHLSKAQSDFQRFRSSLKLGEHLSLKPPAGFESNRHSISLSFESLPELQKHIKTLEQLALDEEFVHLIDSRDPDSD